MQQSDKSEKIKNVFVAPEQLKKMVLSSGCFKAFNIIPKTRSITLEIQIYMCHWRDVTRSVIFKRFCLHDNFVFLDSFTPKRDARIMCV